MLDTALFRLFYSDTTTRVFLWKRHMGKLRLLYKTRLGKRKSKEWKCSEHRCTRSSCYLLCLWVYCRSSYSCWFVNCLSPTRCHLSVVPQSPSHVGRPAWRLPTSLTCSNRPHLRHTPPDPSGINSFSLNFCAAITASQSVLCSRGERGGSGGGGGDRRKTRREGERQMRGMEWVDGWMDRVRTNTR